MDINKIDKVASKVADKATPGWRNRQKHRKSLWHASKILLFPISLAITGLLILKSMLYIQSFFISSQTMSQSGIPELLFILPLSLPIFGLSFILTNIILLSIPPARKAFDAEAKNDKTLSFKHATTSLLKLNIKYFIPIGFGLSFSGLYLMAQNQ